jgi:hypothetical protein
MRKIGNFFRIGFSALLIAIATLFSTCSHAGLTNIPGPVYATQTNDTATPGFVGDCPSVIGTSTALTNASAVSLASLSLPPGNWRVFGAVAYTASATNLNAYAHGFTTTNNTLPTNTYNQAWANITGQGSAAASAPEQIFRLATTTTIYLVGVANFSTGTVSGQAQMTACRFR